ncbi:MAG: hypothetical protein R3B72_26885 [Polyangiaceae bacterium]
MRLSWLPLALGGGLVFAAATCAPDAVLVEETSPPDEGGGGVGASGAGGEGGLGGGGGLSCPGEYSTLPIGQCDLLQQDCPGDEVCVPATDGEIRETHCFPPRGGALFGEPCQSHDDCEGGFSCFYGKCSPFCCPDNDAGCRGDGLCLIQTTHGPYHSFACALLDFCEPFVPGTCDDANPPGNCVLSTSKDALICAPPSGPPLAEGSLCQGIEQCGEFATCFPPGGAEQRCRYVCMQDLAGMPPGQGGCPAGQACASYGSATPGLGVCLP